MVEFHSKQLDKNEFHLKIGTQMALGWHLVVLGWYLVVFGWYPINLINLKLFNHIAIQTKYFDHFFSFNNDSITFSITKFISTKHILMFHGDLPPEAEK